MQKLLLDGLTLCTASLTLHAWTTKVVVDPMGITVDAVHAHSVTRQIGQ